MSLDLDRGFYPIDLNGKITIREIVETILDIIEDGGGGGSGGTVTVDSITDASTVGKSVLKASDAAAARTAIGAGTSNIKVGTAATDAKAGNWNPPNVSTSAAGLMLSADKVKLDGVAAESTKNDTDANLKNRANHTGSQAISTITNLQTTLDAKATSAALALLDARVAALETP